MESENKSRRPDRSDEGFAADRNGSRITHEQGKRLGLSYREGEAEGSEGTPQVGKLDTKKMLENPALSNSDPLQVADDGTSRVEDSVEESVYVVEQNGKYKDGIPPRF
jgi:hypothetical protein